jgi:cytochrome c peroxidase
VIDHYSNNIKGSDNLSFMLRDISGKPISLNISDPDKQAIIAFLGSLTDYEMVADPKFSNPFKIK